MKKCADCAWEDQCQRRTGEAVACNSFWQKPTLSDEIKMIEEMIHHEMGAI